MRYSSLDGQGDLSWQEVANVFSTNWHSVFSAVRWVVEYGLKHRDLSGILLVGNR